MDPMQYPAQSDEPVISVVDVNGEPMWHATGNGISVYNRSGLMVIEMYEAELAKQKISNSSARCADGPS
jgi:hypothetical protein